MSHTHPAIRVLAGAGGALLLVALLALPAPAGTDSPHQITLIDGSVLQGRLLALSDSLLVFRTEFADSLRIPRARVQAIYLGEERPAPAGEAPAPVAAAPAPEGTGQLEVALVGDAPRSSARYRRPNERERMVRLNTLHFKVFVDGALVYADKDDTIEKDYTDSGWTLLRNDHEFPPALLELPTGTHRVIVVVGNELGEIAQGEKQSELFSSELQVEEVIVRPNEKTRLAIAGDGSRFKYGKFKLKLLSSR